MFEILIGSLNWDLKKDVVLVGYDLFPSQNDFFAIIQSLWSSANVHLDPPNGFTRTNQMIPYLMFWKI